MFENLSTAVLDETLHLIPTKHFSIQINNTVIPEFCSIFTKHVYSVHYHPLKQSIASWIGKYKSEKARIFFEMSQINPIRPIIILLNVSVPKLMEIWCQNLSNFKINDFH